MKKRNFQESIDAIIWLNSKGKKFPDIRNIELSLNSKYFCACSVLICDSNFIQLTLNVSTRMEFRDISTLANMTKKEIIAFFKKYNVGVHVNSVSVFNRQYGRFIKKAKKRPVVYNSAKYSANFEKALQLFYEKISTILYVSLDRKVVKFRLFKQMQQSVKIIKTLTHVIKRINLFLKDKNTHVISGAYKTTMGKIIRLNMQTLDI